jgi:hypothetical protein
MLGRVRALVAVLAIAQLAQPRLQQPIAQTPPATLSYGALLTYGRHATGWRFEVPLDPRRTYEPAAGDKRGSGLRPVPTTVFYPAEIGSGEEAAFGALAELSAYSAFADPPQIEIDKAKQQFVETIGASAAARISLRSRKNATPASGRYPMILFAHTTPIGQAVMSEYLASHGFVVAGVMSKGESAGPYRLGVGEIRGMVADLETALRVVLALPFADRTRVAAIGMSNGAFGAVGLGLRLPVAAIVSLDGTIAERAAARILPELTAANPLPPQPSVLHLYTPDNPYLDLAQLKARGPACAAVRIPAFAHADFLSFGLLVKVGPPPFTRLRPAEKFASINRLTLEFLRDAFHARPPAVRLTDGDRILGLELHAC